ncbi:Ribosome biogenesis protein erb1 [Phlyctochytrium planicorne]|nr:Ribosome biogenesis protein erb1 [Phlyctochytrium planicorne]
MKRKVLAPVSLPDDIIPDYNSDTSDEDAINNVGNIPLEWYDDHDHIGYDLSGQRVLRTLKTGDALDDFLKNTDNPDIWRSVIDKATGSSVALSDEDIKILQRVLTNKFPDENYDPYEDSVDFFTNTVEQFPLSSVPEPKRRFIPSKVEAGRIMKIVRAIRKGTIVLGAKPTELPKLYDIWEGSTSSLEDRKMHIPPPKLSLPDHRESYNPPEEYLLNGEEAQEKGLNYVPKKLINVDPESLIPKLPSRRELEPYPTRCSVIYDGHTNRIRSLAFDVSGKWICSGSDDGTARVWDVLTGRNVATWNLDAPVMFVSWNPTYSFVAIASEKNVYFAVPAIPELRRKAGGVLEALKGKGTVWILIQKVSLGLAIETETCQWRNTTSEEEEKGFDFVLTFNHAVTSVVWHRKGEYFATVSPEGGSAAVLIHHLAKTQSQMPFKKSLGLVQKVLFHPLRPEIAICTQQSIRLYNLAKQELANRLYPGVKWISSIDIHPQGDHIIMGSFDKRLCWFDLDLSPKPYKILRYSSVRSHESYRFSSYHNKAIRNAMFHRRFPLFASCSDDGTVNVFHSMVYSDLDRNPLIVPLKSLKAHSVKDNQGDSKDLA